jgi:ribonuclease J
MDGELVRGRVRALMNGSVTLTMVLDKVGNFIGDPQLTTIGLLETGELDFEDDVLDAAEEAVERLSKKDLRNDDVVSETIRIAVRRYFRSKFNKNAVTSVHLVRVNV